MTSGLLVWWQARQPKNVTMRLPLDDTMTTTGGGGSQGSGGGVGLPPSSLATTTSWHRFKLKQKQKAKAAQVTDRTPALPASTAAPS